MKGRRHILVAACICVFLTRAALGQIDRSPSINTSGSAEIRVVPDQVEVTVGVESAHAELAAAKAANDKTIAEIMAITKRYKVPADRIQTEFINIEPYYKNDKDLKPAKYTVRRSLAIVSSDISQFDQLLSALVEAGANQVHSIRFMTSKLREHRDEARKMAARAAQEKAQLIAESLGRRVGRARNISEASDSWSSSYSWSGQWRGAFAANTSQNSVVFSGAPASDAPLAPGRISVTASVSVAFDLE